MKESTSVTIMASLKAYSKWSFLRSKGTVSHLDTIIAGAFRGLFIVRVCVCELAYMCVLSRHWKCNGWIYFKPSFIRWEDVYLTLTHSSMNVLCSWQFKVYTLKHAKSKSICHSSQTSRFLFYFISLENFFRKKNFKWADPFLMDCLISVLHLDLCNSPISSVNTQTSQACHVIPRKTSQPTSSNNTLSYLSGSFLQEGCTSAAVPLVVWRAFPTA